MCSACCLSSLEELRRLDGPPGTFIGHRLTADPDILAVVEARAARQGAGGNGHAHGPAGLAPFRGGTADRSRSARRSRYCAPRGNQLEIVRANLAAPGGKEAVREAMQGNWPGPSRKSSPRARPEIGRPFARADAALAASPHGDARTRIGGNPDGLLLQV